jgi:hypothetical protein
MSEEDLSIALAELFPFPRSLGTARAPTCGMQTRQRSQSLKATMGIEIRLITTIDSMINSFNRQ